PAPVEPAPAPAASVSAPAAPVSAPVAAAQAAEPAGVALCVRIVRVNPKDAQSLAEEIGNLGRVLHTESSPDSLAVWVDTTCAEGDIEAVCGFIVNDDQI